MKQCTECGSTYSDRIDFCFHDGSELIAAVAEATGAQSGLDLDDSMDLPSLDAPSAPGPNRPERAALTPLPLAELTLPESVIREQAAPVASPLAAPPPAPTVPPASPLAEPPPPVPSSAPVAETPDASQPRAARAGDAPQALDAASAATPAPVPDEVEDDTAGGVPIWAWVAGGMGLVVAVFAVVFAFGGLSAVGAAFNARVAGRQAPPPPPVAAAAGEPSTPADEEDRFPVPPLQVGLAAVHGEDGADTDADAVADGSDTDSELVDGDELPVLGAPAEPVKVGVVDAAATEAAGGSAGSDTGGGTSGGGTEASTPRDVPPVTDPPTPGTDAPTSTPEPTGGVTETPDSGAGTAADPPSPWGATEPPPASDAVPVKIRMDGGGAGLKLFVDGQEQAGSFPFDLMLGPGMHRFRVVDSSGKQYEIGKPIRKGPTGGMSLQLFPP